MRLYARSHNPVAGRGPVRFQAAGAAARRRRLFGSSARSDASADGHDERLEAVAERPARREAARLCRRCHRSPFARNRFGRTDVVRSGRQLTDTTPLWAGRAHSARRPPMLVGRGPGVELSPARSKPALGSHAHAQPQCTPESDSTVTPFGEPPPDGVGQHNSRWPTRADVGGRQERPADRGRDRGPSAATGSRPEL